MITIIHGEDTTNSRDYYYSLKKDIASPTVLEEGNINLNNLVQLIEGNTLFGGDEKKSVFIEKFFTQKKQSLDYDEIVEFIQKNEKKAEFIFWEPKEVGKKVTGLFKQPTVKVFSYPKQMFAFLDSITPNSSTSVSLFHQALKHSEPELLFFLMIRQFRLLIALSEKKIEQSSDDIDEVKRLAPWQKSKLTKQASLFQKQRLLEVYKRLFDIDLAQKTGASPLLLTQAIDIFLLDL